MNSAEWKRFRLEEDRQQLLIAIDRALDRVPGVESAELDDEFTRCLSRGGVDAAYAFTEEIDAIQAARFFSLVAEDFIRARIAPVQLTKRKRTRRAKRLLELAETLAYAAIVARDLEDVPRWCTSLSGSLGGDAEQLLRLAREDIEIRKEAGLGRQMEISTSFALSLDALFRGRVLPLTTRCKLIAGVISAFVEPINGEQVRQRLKDLRRRPRASGQP